MPSGKRRSYRASNFCERPKITGRRVPDVAENRNFENWSPFVTAALLVACLYLRLPFDGKKKNGDAFVTKGIHSNVRFSKYVMFLSFVAYTYLITNQLKFWTIRKKYKKWIVLDLSGSLCAKIFYFILYKFSPLRNPSKKQPSARPSLSYFREIILRLLKIF